MEACERLVWAGVYVRRAHGSIVDEVEIKKNLECVVRGSYVGWHDSFPGVREKVG